MAEQNINTTSKIPETDTPSVDSAASKPSQPTAGNKSSKKLWIIGLAVVVLIAVGAGAFFFEL